MYVSFPPFPHPRLCLSLIPGLFPNWPLKAHICPACSSHLDLDSVLIRIQVDVEKRYVTVQAGITLEALHAQLARHGLAMSNVGSISDQTLGGIVTTATHGTGIAHGVISTRVIALSLLLADASQVTCSRSERSDLFLASICGLGSTGLIMSVTLQVDPSFRLREVQESLPFDNCIRMLPTLVHASEYVRFWWFPAADQVRVYSADRTVEVCTPST